MDAPIISALIAGAVSLAGASLTLNQSKRNLAAKLAELDLKREELQSLGKRLVAESEALRQNIMRDILAKRMSAYAALWKVFITHERNAILERKSLDLAWAEAFIRELNICNADHGVFFSQQVYAPFFEYRRRLLEIAERLRSGHAIGPPEIDSLVECSSKGVQDKMLSLATAMKDDLGSYMKVAIQSA
jgi:hypothetical protein